MIGQTYLSTPYVRRLSRENGWRGGLVRDEYGRVDMIVTVRIGPVWTDAVVIVGEDRVIAMRHRTDEDNRRLLVPGTLPAESRAVWQRDGRAEDVLAELLELQETRPQ